MSDMVEFKPIDIINTSPANMKPKNVSLQLTAVVLSTLTILPFSADATSNYTYKPGEYVTIVDGQSPNGEYSVAAHGEGAYGYEHFHIYLMGAKTKKPIGPLKEIKETLDTGADAFYARWSADSRQVSITYRVDRHVAVMVRYRIENGRAYLINGPSKVEGLPGH
jgi:hypothetical protein